MTMQSGIEIIIMAHPDGMEQINFLCNKTRKASLQYLVRKHRKLLRLVIGIQIL